MEKNKNKLKIVNMRAFRLVNELSQKEVAEYLEVSIAFISSVERGAARLPADKLARLLENDRDWDTEPLVESTGTGMSVHHDHRTIGQNIEGAFNGPVHNYNGFSEEEFDRELKRRTELMQERINYLEGENDRLRQELLHERARLDRLIGLSGDGAAPKEAEE